MTTNNKLKQDLKCFDSNSAKIAEFFSISLTYRGHAKIQFKAHTEVTSKYNLRLTHGTPFQVMSC